jgi:hypothetical protein
MSQAAHEASGSQPDQFPSVWCRYRYRLGIQNKMRMGIKKSVCPGEGAVLKMFRRRSPAVARSNARASRSCTFACSKKFVGVSKEIVRDMVKGNKRKVERSGMIVAVVLCLLRHASSLLCCVEASLPQVVMSYNILLKKTESFVCQCPASVRATKKERKGSSVFVC